MGSHDEGNAATNNLRQVDQARRQHLVRRDAVAQIAEQIGDIDALDADAVAARYEAELARFGPPDLALAGIGVNGHVAYLEPGAELAPVTSRVSLSPATRRALESDGIVPAPRGEC